MKNTKYLVILGDGMADYADNDGQTPLTYAIKPNIDYLANNGECGLCQTIPQGMKPGSDTANLSVMGYDPNIYYTGRSPLEAISIGIKLDDADITYRCNLVTLSNEDSLADKIMIDYSAGEISTNEAKELIDTLSKELSLSGLELYTGVSYRHCLVRRNGNLGAVLTPPHDITDKNIAQHLPTGEYSQQILQLMQESIKILNHHPVNIKRRQQGKNTADCIWLWGEGRKPSLDNFQAKFGLNGAVISAVDLIKGIGLGAKLDSIDVEGATGTIHTNFVGKANAAIDALKTHDYVYVHLEAPDECGHQGDKAGKILSIEKIDSLIVKPLYQYLKTSGNPFKMLIIPDHATPLSLRTHTSDPVPYIIYDSQKQMEGVNSYNEFTAKSTGHFINKGCDLNLILFKKTN